MARRDHSDVFIIHNGSVVNADVGVPPEERVERSFVDQASIRACGPSLASPKEKLTGVSISSCSSPRSFSVWFINARSLNNIERRGVVTYF